MSVMVGSVVWCSVWCICSVSLLMFYECIVSVYGLLSVCLMFCCSMWLIIVFCVSLSDSVGSMSDVKL